jgi:tol-pal system protein YbgF
MLFFISGCVESQDVGVLDSRIATLETYNIKHLNKEKEYDNKLNKIYSDYNKLVQNGTTSRVRYAELKVELDNLKEKIRLLTGRIEELEHNFLKDNSTIDREKELQRLDNAVSQNFQKILQLEQYIGFEPSSSTIKENGTQSQPKPIIKSEQSIYKQAKQFLDAGKTDMARSKFQEFIKLYPGSANADNALFWIADSYYRDKWYEKAILEYQKVIEKYPKGNKVAAALLKQGFAFSNLGEKANARLLLKELIKKYPSSHEAKIAKDKLRVLK